MTPEPPDAPFTGDPATRDPSRPCVPTSRLVRAVERYRGLTDTERTHYLARIRETETSPDARAVLRREVWATQEAASRASGLSGRDPRWNALYSLWLGLRAWDRGLRGDPWACERVGS